MNIDCAYYVGGKHQPLEPMSLAEAAALPRHGGSFVWIELNDPGPDVMEEVRVEFGLHELAIEDASVEHQRPKVEGYDGFHLIVYRTARFDAPTRQVSSASSTCSSVWDSSSRCGTVKREIQFGLGCGPSSIPSC